VDLDVGGGSRRDRDMCEPKGRWVKPAKKGPLDGRGKKCKTLLYEECGGTP